VPQPIEGHFAVEESARLIRHYRYAVERMMRTLGGWLALTPEVSAKLLMGRHVWDCAQHADALGKRLPELRAHAQESEPANAAFVAFMDALESPEAPGQTIERLTGVYRVLKPHLVATYQRHLEAANGVYEPPTQRILARCLEDERRHIAGGETVLRHLGRADEAGRRAASWQAALRRLLAAANGVSGGELSAPDGVPAMALVEASSAEAEEFIRLESAHGQWPIPEDLLAAIGTLADGLIGGDEAAVARHLAPGLSPAGDWRVALEGTTLSASRIVACARIGAQRMVKLRLEGPEGSVTLAARWISTPGGWRMAAAEVARIDVARSA